MELISTAWKGAREIDIRNEDLISTVWKGAREIDTKNADLIPAFLENCGKLVSET